MTKPKVVSLERYRQSGEIANPDGVYEAPEAVPFDIENPATQIPSGEALNEPLPDYIRARREELKRKKTENGRNRTVGKAILGGTAIAAVALAMTGHNSRSPEETPKAVPIHIQAGENVSTAIERFYKETHPGKKVDMDYVYSQAHQVIERELDGSSLVHEGDVIYIAPA